MPKDYARELDMRVRFLQNTLSETGATGFVYGNSGGKDSALVGILCRRASENTVGLIMPCSSKRNYAEDMDDALAVAEAFGIKTLTIDLGKTREELCGALEAAGEISRAAAQNIAPRLRMTALYAVAQSGGMLVAGTGNRSERHMGYFTKWGDAACDINPIADLTVTEIFAFLRYLKAPGRIVDKAPSAGLFDGQTDEADMGVSYAAIDGYLLTGKASDAELTVIEKRHRASGHKRRPPYVIADN